MKTVKEVLSGLARWVVFNVFLSCILFGLPGRSDLPMFRAFFAVSSALALAAILSMDPELARERRRPGPGGIDRVRRLFIGFLFLTQLVVAALDAGSFHFSDTVPFPLRVAALPLYAVSMGLVIWAVAVNRFFSPVVRIQRERGHRLVTAGPYRAVRHPGYLGMCLAFPASALALGSWWSLVPAGLCTLLVLRRAALEDRYLKENLEGYPRYAREVRYRLVPGLW